MNKKPITNLSQYTEAVSKAGVKPPKEEYFTHGGVCPACGNKSLQDGPKYVRCGYVACPYFEVKTGKFTLHVHEESCSAWISDHWEGPGDGCVEPVLLDVSLEECQEKIKEYQKSGYTVKEKFMLIGGDNQTPPWEPSHGSSITQLMPEHIRENPRSLRIVGICGEPGTGKTTLMRKIISRIDRKAEEDWEEFKHGTLYFRKKRSFIVFGSYVGEPFDGTDKLSMAVVNDAEDFIDKMSGTRVQILFEGDRLFCERFINFCRQRAETLFYRLTVGADVMFQRQAVRELKGIKQTASFIQGRRTKYDNLCSRFTSIIKMPNSNTIEAAKILNNIYQFLGG